MFSQLPLFSDLPSSSRKRETFEPVTLGHMGSPGCWDFARLLQFDRLQSPDQNQRRPLARQDGRPAVGRPHGLRPLRMAYRALLAYIDN